MGEGCSVIAWAAYQQPPALKRKDSPSSSSHQLPKDRLLGWSLWVPLASTLGCWRAWSPADNHSCEFRSATAVWCPEDSISSISCCLPALTVYIPLLYAFWALVRRREGSSDLTEMSHSWLNTEKSFIISSYTSYESAAQWKTRFLWARLRAALIYRVVNINILKAVWHVSLAKTVIVPSTSTPGPISFLDIGFWWGTQYQT